MARHIEVIDDAPVALAPPGRFAQFVAERLPQILLCYLAYVIVLLAIGLNNVPYIDDVRRVRTGATDWWFEGSRWGSEAFAFLLSGGRSHVIDFGLMGFLISAFLLGTASIITVYALIGERANLLSFGLAALIGINPWFLNAVAFRIDGPLIAMSVLTAVVPLLWFGRNPWIFGALTALSIITTFNFFETTIGFTLVLLSTALFLAVMRHRLPTRALLLDAGAVIVGMAIGFAAVMAQIRVQATRVGIDNYSGMPNEWRRLPGNIIWNLEGYVLALRSDSPLRWIIAFLAVFVLVIFTQIVVASIPGWQAALAMALYMPVTFALSASFWLLLDFPRLTVYPRYISVFGMWVAVLAIISTQTHPAAGGVESAGAKARRWVTWAAVVPFAYITLAFAFSFASAQRYQQEFFTVRTTALLANLAGIYEPGDVIMFDRIMRTSPVVANSAVTQPLLNRLLEVGGHPSYSWAARHRFGLLSGIEAHWIRASDQWCAPSITGELMPDLVTPDWAIIKLPVSLLDSLGRDDEPVVDFEHVPPTGNIICLQALWED